MGLFHHHSGIESEYITHFRVDHGNREADLTWDLRDQHGRDVVVFRSEQGFVAEGTDPTADDRQTLVYQGRERHVRLSDEHLTNDVAYYYSIFARGDDGDWHLQLTDTVAPHGAGEWRRSGQADRDEVQRVIDLDLDLGASNGL